MSLEEFKEMVLSFQGIQVHPHFDRTAFKVEGRRIIATLHEESESANIVLPIPEQELFCALNKAIYPAPNKWGPLGWTTFELKKTDHCTVLDALSSAYQDVVKKRHDK
ncbi:MAG TPA: MmcQ/YjbR family DNA-binding protein [Hanamia sp.]|nr:MmcQ/YjbR family DNA-binding protein [Hanamia sp.]